MTGSRQIPIRPPVIRPAPPRDLEIVVVARLSSQSTVHVRGELDLAAGDLFTAALEHELALGHRFVLLDLSQLTFLDCAGLRALVAAHRTFRAARGTIVLSGIGSHVKRLLSITGADEALFVADVPAPRDPPRNGW